MVVVWDSQKQLSNNNVKLLLNMLCFRILKVIIRKGPTNACCPDSSPRIHIVCESLEKKKKSSFAVGAGRTKTPGAVDIINLACLMVPVVVGTD